LAALLVLGYWLKSELDESNARLADETKQMESLGAKIAAESSINDSMKEQVKTLESKISTLEDSLKTANTERSTANAKLADLALALAKQNENVQKDVPSIMGEAFIRNSQGNVISLAGSTVYLLNSDATKFQTDFQKDWTTFENLYKLQVANAGASDLELAAFLQFLDNNNYPIDLGKGIEQTVEDRTAAYKVSSTPVLANGAFEFDQVSDGQYVLFAVLRSTTAAVVWFVPVQTQKGKTAQISLSNNDAVYGFIR
jgi:hypothetical protein